MSDPKLKEELERAYLDIVEHEDGCLCNIEIHADETTGDDELPAASGGIEVSFQAAVVGDIETLDGCDLDFSLEPTSDEELPEATQAGVV